MTSIHDPDILVLGPFPPPYGGVSSYVQRLVGYLRNSGYRAVVLNHFATRKRFPEVIGTLRRNPLWYLFAPPRVGARLVHYHHSRWSTLVAVAVASRRDPRPYVITIHGHSVMKSVGSQLPLVARATRWALRQFDEVIVVSRELREAIAPVVGPNAVTILPAFLPPSADELSQSRCSHTTAAFIEEADPALVISAYRIVPAGTGDLYGLDTAVDVLRRVRAVHPRARLVVHVALRPRGRWARRYLDGIMRRAHEQCPDALLVCVGEPLLPALQPGVVYLRPSRGDGDAVAIREALALGVPVVASDVVARPVGVVVRPMEDADALARAVIAAVASAKGAAGTADGVEFGAQILRIYRRCLGEGDTGETIADVIQRVAG